MLFNVGQNEEKSNLNLFEFTHNNLFKTKEQRFFYFSSVFYFVKKTDCFLLFCETWLNLNPCDL